MTGGHAPVLIAAAHGTRSPAGRRAIAQLRIAVAALRPGLEVAAASVDVQKPALPDVVRRLTGAGRRCVVVPLLLAGGYHVKVDIARAVAAGHGLAVAAPPLAPDPAIVEVLADRLAACPTDPDGTDPGGTDPGGTDPGGGGALVLGAAGSSDPAALADVERVAAGLARHLARSVTPAYLSAAAPAVADAVATARASAPGRPVTISTFLLSPGFFADRLAACGADRVTAPMAPHPRLAELVLRRYEEALAGSARMAAPPA